MTEQAERVPEALLLDFGGVVLRSGHDLMGRLPARHPATTPVVERRGDFGSEPDELWERMLREEISERDYWSLRAREVGDMLGRDWDTRDFMAELYAGPPSGVLHPDALDLVADVRPTGVRLGVLTNDLAAFHGPEWIEQMDILREMDAIVDGSATGVLKPDPRAYRLAAEALGTPCDRILFLDDMPWNVAGARSVGMTAHQVDLTRPVAAFDLARRQLGLDAAA